ncbi:zonular occludens toxin domain-containing protein [Oceanobacter mangrovi]|uniref:zonular occludens toxin domain-containing protein n=1 Tax=Oceanobacter mangrovi TaxID=2862510 RepID=UPI001C8E2F58|nr:zonular occludens toxin domain-containing protein [Oceanobacter mangrovi]
MSITAYTGLPGSGKSYNSVANVIEPALKQGRTVVTNVVLRKEELYKKYPDANLVTFPMSTDRDSVEKWINLANYPAGAIYVIDEAGKMFSSGWKQNSAPTSVLQFFTEHRHSVSPDGYSCEIFLLCQDVNQLAKWVRDLIASTYIHTKMERHGMSKRFRVDIYVGGIASTRPPATSKIDSKFGSYKDEVTCLYQSYTQSKSLTDTALEDNPDKRASFVGQYKMYAAVAVLGLPLCIWMASIAISGLFGMPPEPATTEQVSATSDTATAPDQTQLANHPAMPGQPAGVLNRFTFMPSSPESQTLLDKLMPGYHLPDYYDLPWSPDWRLTGVIRGRVNSYALISSVDRSRRIALHRFCFFERDFDDWACVINGQLITEFTGPAFDTVTADVEPDAEDVKRAFKM